MCNFTFCSPVIHLPSHRLAGEVVELQEVRFCCRLRRRPSLSHPEVFLSFSAESSEQLLFLLNLEIKPTCGSRPAVQSSTAVCSDKLTPGSSSGKLYYPLKVNSDVFHSLSMQQLKHKEPLPAPERL